MQRTKIFITGGHLTPALAVVDLLNERKWQIWFIGRKYAQEEDTSISVEYKTLINYTNKIKLLLITTGKIQRYFNFNTLLSLLKFPIGFVQCFYWFCKFQPEIVLSFGGYIAVPVCIVAKVFSVPIVIQEQTNVMGLANKIIAKIADKICLSWKVVKPSLPNHKIVITGTPLRKAIFTASKKFEIDLNKPLLYVTGGSLGSHAINELIKPIISSLLRDFSIIHQCGETQKYNDYEKLKSLRRDLPTHFQERYLPLTYIQATEIGWVYQNTYFVVGRSGANTVYELAALGIPAIFIPLPFSAGNEQSENARIYQQYNAGIIVEQKNLSSTFLYNEIIRFKSNIQIYRNNAQRLKKEITLKGASNLVKVLTRVLNKSK